MNLPYALNTFFGPALIIILIFAECMIKYSSNRKIKTVFVAFLTVTFLSMTIDFILSAFNIFNVISVKLIWPIMAALLLYAYLFIVIKENKIDTLTGLDNRYSFYEFTGRLSRSRSGESWTIAILDIDNFKSINEIYGNLEGDSALRNLARIIKDCVRKTDFAARYGGDEFVIITKVKADIDNLVANIKEELGKHNKNSTTPYDIEISCEFDTYTADGSIPINKFLKNIDELMYKRNKESRRTGDLKA